MKRLLVCLLVLIMGILCLSAAAEDSANGRLLFRMEANRHLPDRSGIEISLYRIGGVAAGTETGWVIDDAYSSAGVLSAGNSNELDQAGDRVAAIIARTGAQPIAGGQTNRNGRLTFAGLTPGVYFGRMSNGPEQAAVTMQNFIVTVPGVQNGVAVYDVALSPKYTAEAEPPMHEDITPYIPKGYVIIEDLLTPLGLGEIQIHVGVCYE